MLDLNRVLLSERVFTLEQSAAFLGRSFGQVQRYVSEGALKPHRIGISPVLLQSELVAAVTSGALASEHPLPVPPQPPQPKHPPQPARAPASPTPPRKRKDKHAQ